MKDLEVFVPAADSPGVLRLRERLKMGEPVIVQILPAEFSRPFQCYQNVDYAVQQFGGRRIDGWALWQYEDFFAEAEHHAIWQSPRGEMACISPQEYKTDRLLFCSSAFAKYEGRRIQNEREILRCRQKVETYLSAVDATNQVRYEFHEQGLQLEDYLMKPRFSVALSAAESALIALCEERPTNT